jgi:hypothetical protein
VTNKWQWLYFSMAREVVCRLSKGQKKISVVPELCNLRQAYEFCPSTETAHICHAQEGYKSLDFAGYSGHIGEKMARGDAELTGWADSQHYFQFEGESTETRRNKDVSFTAEHSVERLAKANVWFHWRDNINPSK